MAASKGIDSEGRAPPEQFYDACNNSQDKLEGHDGEDYGANDGVPLHFEGILLLGNPVLPEDGEGEQQSEEGGAKAEEDVDEHPKGSEFVEGENDGEVDDKGPDVEHAVVVGEVAPGLLEKSSLEVLHKVLLYFYCYSQFIYRANLLQDINVLKINEFQFLIVSSGKASSFLTKKCKNKRMEICKFNSLNQ